MGVPREKARNNTATHATVFDVDVEDALEPLHPAHGSPTRRMRLAGGWVGRVGDDTVAVLAVRCEHAVVSGEMGAGTRNEGGEQGDMLLGPGISVTGVNDDWRGWQWSHSLDGTPCARRGWAPRATVRSTTGPLTHPLPHGRRPVGSSDRHTGVLRIPERCLLTAPRRLCAEAGERQVRCLPP